MGRIVDLKWSEKTCMLTLFTIFGIGFGYANEGDEKTLTLTLKISRFHTFCTIGLI